MQREKIVRKLSMMLYIGIITLLMSPMSSYAMNIDIGDPAPDFTLNDLTTGKTLSLSDFKGKPVILTFWATWCPRCWEELDYVSARFSDDSSVQILLVNMETQSSSPAHLKRIKKKAAEHQVKFPMLLDKKLKVWDIYGVNSLPTTVIVDAEGKVAFAEPNFYFASRDNIEAVIKELLKK